MIARHSASLGPENVLPQTPMLCQHVRSRSLFVLTSAPCGGAAMLEAGAAFLLCVFGTRLGHDHELRVEVPEALPALTGNGLLVLWLLSSTL